MAEEPTPVNAEAQEAEDEEYEDDDLEDLEPDLKGLVEYVARALVDKADAVAATPPHPPETHGSRRSECGRDASRQRGDDPPRGRSGASCGPVLLAPGDRPCGCKRVHRGSARTRGGHPRDGRE